MAPRQKNAFTKGFTVVELIVAFLIIAILGGMLAPAVGSAVRGSLLHSATSQASSALRRARNMAIAKGTPHCLRFVQNSPPIAEIFSVEELPTSDPATIGRSAGGVSLPEGVLAGFVDTSEPPQYVIFLPDGSAWAWSAAGAGVRPWPASARVRIELEPSRGHGLLIERQEIAIRALTGRIDIGDVETLRRP